MNQAKRFLNEQSILYPSDEVLRRLVVKQRQMARDHIYERVVNLLVQDLTNHYCTFLREYAQNSLLSSPGISIDASFQKYTCPETGAGR